MFRLSRIIKRRTIANEACDAGIYFRNITWWFNIYIHCPSRILLKGLAIIRVSDFSPRTDAIEIMYSDHSAVKLKVNIIIKVSYKKYQNMFENINMSYDP